MSFRISILSAVALTLAGFAGLISTVRAHVTLEADEAIADQSHKAVLRVPHGCNGQATNVVRVSIPEGVIDVKPMPKAGWAVDVVRGAYAKTYMLSGKPVTEGAKEIVWSKGDLPDGFYDEFTFLMRPTGELAGKIVALPVVQECASAKAAWTELAQPGQDPHALKNPAPTLKVAAKRVAEAANTFKAGAIVVESPWARATPSGAKVGGGYFKLRNTGAEPDRLIGFSSPVAARGEIHDMAVVDGVMRMREMKALDIPPGATVEFKPGGMHVMFLDLKGGLVEGMPVKARLTFEKAGSVEIEFSVAPIGARRRACRRPLASLSGAAANPLLAWRFQMDSRRKTSIMLGALLAVLIVCLVALAALTGLLRPLYDPQGAMTPIAGIGGPLRLTSQTGERIDTSKEGKPFAVFFGFTHCPDVCPTTLSDMTQTLTELGPQAKDLRIYFVTVDPERDTPEVLASYMGSFDRRLIGLTGSRDEIDAVIRAYRVYARKAPTKDGDYTMDHTASTYLMDGRGRLVGTLAYQENEKTRLDKLKRLVRAG